MPCLFPGCKAYMSPAEKTADFCPKHAKLWKAAGKPKISSAMSDGSLVCVCGHCGQTIATVDVQCQRLNSKESTMDIIAAKAKPHATCGRQKHFGAPNIKALRTLRRAEAKAMKDKKKAALDSKPRKGAFA